MILLTARDLSRQFGNQPVFRNVEFEVRTGEKIGLVGPNGSGKTTLMNILAGHDDPDVGAVELRPSCDVVLVEQQPDFPPGQTLIAEARLGLAHLYQLQHEAVELAELIAREAQGDDLRKHQRRYDQIQQELERHDAYHVEHRVDEVLSGLGFDKADYDRPLAQFSGGQQNRAILARMLLREPDLMLLDEPTNHLDIAATEWLEGYLSKSRQAMIVVSHDRYFLDRVANRILEIVQAKVTSYSGNFTAYRKQKEERNKVLQRTYDRQQEFVAKTEDFIRRNKSGQKSNQAHDREKKLARLDEAERPQDETTPTMHFGKAARAGDWVIDAVDVCKGYGEPLIRDFTLRIARGDRVGILGPNGSGKTTLLRTLIGDLRPDAGKVRHGTNVEIGYFDQQLTSVSADATAIDAVRPPGDMSFTPAVSRRHLARFGVRGETALQTVAQMSGGEKSKVALARLAALDVNLLVLDEPTNHLDLWARESLEDALKVFEGTLLFVSHDRYFIDRIAEHVIVLEEDGWRYHSGNYSAYVGFRQNRAVEQKAQATPEPVVESFEPAPPDADDKPRGKAAKKKRKFPFRKVADIEAEIAEHEELVEQLQASLADPDVHRDGDRARETLQAFEATQERLEELYEHWEEAIELN